MDISAEFNQTITVQSPTGVAGPHGDPTFTNQPQRSVRARVEPSTRLVRSSVTGEEVLSSHFVMTAEQLSQFDRVWLPGANTASVEAARSPVRIDTPTDLDASQTWFEVYF